MTYEVSNFVKFPSESIGIRFGNLVATHHCLEILCALPASGVEHKTQLDDDDENGVVDAVQASTVPAADLRSLSLASGRDVRIRAQGGIRLLRDGRPLAQDINLSHRQLPVVLGLQGVRVSTDTPASLQIESGGVAVRLSMEVVEKSSKI